MNNIQKLSVVVAAGCLLASLFVSYYTNGYVVTKRSYNKPLYALDLREKIPYDTWAYGAVPRGDCDDYLKTRECYNKMIDNEVLKQTINPTGDKVYYYKAHMPTIIPLSLLLLCGLSFYLFKDD